MRLIDADELINTTKRGAKFASLFADDEFKTRVLRIMRKFIQRSINDAPTVDAVPVKHGHWIEKRKKTFFEGLYEVEFVCSCCGNVVYGEDKYCFDCGAKMDGGEKNA